MLPHKMRPLYAVIAAHGLTDFDSEAWPVQYATWFAVPLESTFITALFCSLSVVHFSEDIGLGGSLLLHAAVATLGIVRNTNVAAAAMLGYIGIIHVPCHYTRCLRRGRYGALAIAAAGTGLALALCSATTASTVTLCDVTQRIVMSHVCTELLISTQ